MKINFLERDSRRNDPDFEQTCGSFSVIQNILKKGLKELWSYSESPELADYVGVAGSFLDFNYPNKKSFTVLFWDSLNTLSTIHKQQYNPNNKVFSINQHTANLCAKMEIPCKVIGPGIDYNYWYQTKPKNDVFTIISSSFSNYRSGLDQLLEAFCIFAYKKKKEVRLIVKNTSDNRRLEENINKIKSNGYDIQYVNQRLTFDDLRDLYSQCHLGANILRFSAHGLNIAEHALCGCLTLVGDFDPSNTICGNAIKIKPVRMISANDNMDIFKNYGLTNTIGGIPHPEPPLIYEYSLHDYVYALEDIYSSWSNQYSKIDTRTPIVEQWDYLKSARNLIEGLL